MKYLLIIAALIASFNGAVAQEPETEPEKEGFGTAIRGFLADTFSAVQQVDIPTLGSGAVLSSVECSDEERTANACTVGANVEGQYVCRTVGELQFTMCAPKVFDIFVGGPDDTCGCCPGSDCGARSTCLCSCQEGRGVLVKHSFFKFLGRSVAWTACYTPTIATQIMQARAEFGCDDQCPAAVAAATAAAASEEVTTMAPTS
ncbi:expressed unknown protein [Seminavis robusta]|uniref:Uncharacterized protein n=1 Tax=Seminavis robusta TaxID=568900 RepID=A0A9N8EB52_9STRA|nr:expressed unknown protein [Seminavis robusta]|eukprot:Sro834_g208690.1 n/a (203) ;mRNA; r:22784-23392